MNKKYLSVLIVLILVLVSCTNKKELKDGVYKGEAKEEVLGGKTYVNVEITVKGGKIVEVKREELDKNKVVKGSDYGKEAGEKNYKLAQKAVKGSEGYSAKLVELGDIDKVDAVSGATVSYKLFKEAVKNALSKAK